MLYEVCLRSIPGMCELYTATFRVNAEDEETAIAKAKHLTKRDWPDRNASMWKLDSIEIIGE